MKMMAVKMIFYLYVVPGSHPSLFATAQSTDRSFDPFREYTTTVTSVGSLCLRLTAVKKKKKKKLYGCR